MLWSVNDSVVCHMEQSYITSHHMCPQTNMCVVDNVVTVNKMCLYHDMIDR